MAGKLMQQLNAADVSDEEIEALYADLQFIFDSPFDAEINLAVGRGCAYVEQIQAVAH